MNDTQFVPEWAKGIVWYQIFPERFRNGDLSNDPTLDSLHGAWPHDTGEPWQVHPWTSDWYALQPYERKKGGSIWNHLQRRRYGGDLQGILDRLDYLVDLGVGAIYLNPVFDSPSAHKYDGRTYHHIDVHFGPDPAGDRRLIAAETPHDPATWVWTAADRMMLRLIEEVHRRGLRLIFDGVWNHASIDGWAFRDVVTKQQNSPYRDWFKIKSWDDPAAGTTFAYQGWFDVPELPEWRQDEKGIVTGPRDYIYDATRRWMDPDGDGDPRDGIDGWRLDVAFCVAHPFWKKWRRLVRRINPEAYLVAETDPLIDQRPFLEGDEFDAVMNYGFTFAVSEFFITRKFRVTTSDFERRLRELRELAPTQVSHVMQNLLGSHDTTRFASHAVNFDIHPYRTWGEFHRHSMPQHNPFCDTRKPTAAERAAQKLAVLFQMTYIGAPMIYYGDEAGMWGANDPCCRKPMVWPDMEYEPEAVSPAGSPRPEPDEVAFNWDMYNHYQKLIAIRQDSDALRRGEYQTMLIDDDRRLFSFLREAKTDRALVVFNAGDSVHDAEVPAGDNNQWVDVWNGGAIYSATGGGLNLTLLPQSAAILRPASI
jgi:cyclomaltodextrinase / maltogenic alpha-amylase / neopullulanase